MTYSYTQISQYLTCPRRYRHRYLDGWQEKDTRAAMLFGRAFERALTAYFLREDAAAALFREWSVCQEPRLTVLRTVTPGTGCCSKASSSWTGSARTTAFAFASRDETCRSSSRGTVSEKNDFVAYVDAIGKLDGTRCLLEWKTTSSRYPEEPDGLLALDPATRVLFLDDRNF